MKVAVTAGVTASLTLVSLLGGCSSTRSATGAWVKGARGNAIEVTNVGLCGRRITSEKALTQLPAVVNLDLQGTFGCSTVTAPTQIRDILRIASGPDAGAVNCVATSNVVINTSVYATDTDGNQWMVRLPEDGCGAPRAGVVSAIVALAAGLHSQQ
jgi:hypothetical protein